MLDGVERLPGGRAFLGLSLFWKIFAANVVLASLAALAGAAVVGWLDRGGSGGATALGLLGVAAVVVASVAVNGWLLRLALSPLGDLAATARRVREGELGARAPLSPVSDPDLVSLVEVFNEMLDSLSANRSHQLELARRVLESEERERQRIAHELYQGTAQTLAGVLVRLRVADRHVTDDGAEAISEIRDQVVHALDEIRGVARRLRPPELDELGVRAALEAHARPMTEGGPVSVSFAGEVPDLSRESSLALFRIAQEAITNAVLHAEAEEIVVRFERAGDDVTVEVTDDGCGFDPAAALADTGASMGLFGMHERAGYVGGELDLTSGPGRGTRVHAVIPVHAPQTRIESARLRSTAERLVQGIVEPAPDLAAAVNAPHPLSM